MIEETLEQCYKEYIKSHTNEKIPLRPIVFIGREAHEQSERFYDYVHKINPNLRIYFARTNISTEEALDTSFNSDYVINTNEYKLINGK